DESSSNFPPERKSSEPHVLDDVEWERSLQWIREGHYTNSVSSDSASETSDTTETASILGYEDSEKDEEEIEVQESAYDIPLVPFKNLSTRGKQTFSWLIGTELALDRMNQCCDIETSAIIPFTKMKHKDSFRDPSVDLEIVKDLVSDAVYKIIENYQSMCKNKRTGPVEIAVEKSLTGSVVIDATNGIISNAPN
uniref:Uncharacterized protein n=1 Tax=Clytia hemisphaerica TaxID=252671 RepID=A0A7M5UKC8_9CNID